VGSDNLPRTRTSNRRPAAANAQAAWSNWLIRMSQLGSTT
jgi:hypothetical protein